MKVVNRKRYRPPLRWSLYKQWQSYEPDKHGHKWCRITKPGNDPEQITVCLDCGEAL